MKMFHNWHHFDRTLFFSCHFNDKTFRIGRSLEILLFSSLTTRINSRCILTSAIFRFSKFNPDEMSFPFFYSIEDLISLVLDHRKPIVHVSNSHGKTYVLPRSAGPPSPGDTPGEMTLGSSDYICDLNLSQLFRTTRSCYENGCWSRLLRL